MNQAMDFIQWVQDAYLASAPVVLAVCAFLVVALPILGRFIATWKPRWGEAFIRAGSDIKGAIETKTLPSGTPSISAMPLATIAPPRSSAAPPRAPSPPGANGSVPPTLLTTLAMIILATGCVPILFGCTSPIDAAVQVQHAGAAAIDRGGDELQERCTERLAGLVPIQDREARLAKAAPIREVCDPARLAYGVARANLILLSATIAALAGGVTVGELVQLTQTTAQALAEVATTFARLRASEAP